MLLSERYLKEPFHDYSDLDLLTLLIGGDREKSKATAEKLLLHFGSIKHIAQLDALTLYRFSGIGKTTAVRIHAGLLAGRRALFFNHLDNTIRNPEEAYQKLWPHLIGKENEELWALYLNKKKHVLMQKCITTGNNQFTIVDPKQIYRTALLVRASGVIVAHNHPSGDPTPSETDILVTERLEKAGQLINIPLIDHLVIGHDGFSSMATLGMLHLNKRNRLW